MTAAEQLRGQPLGARLAEEVPDEPATNQWIEAGQLVERGDTEEDDEDELVATELPETAGEPAEQNAVRIVPEGQVPGAYEAPDDGYVEEEPA
jgi:hypothetical protein